MSSTSYSPTTHHAPDDREELSVSPSIVQLAQYVSLMPLRPKVHPPRIPLRRPSLPEEDVNKINIADFDDLDVPLDPSPPN
ncbi:hypothetical protein CEK25_004980 [Fusarium fujikuroi]|nr:hypothetical protein CEK25_004980 [Fusarium fujikuroi]